MKYVMFKVEMGEVTLCVPFIFPVALSHKDVHQIAFVVVRRTYPTANIKTRSAGFYTLGEKAYGESETLKLAHHPEDTAIINTHDYLHGISE